MSTVTRVQMIRQCRGLIHGAGVSGARPRLLLVAFTTRRALMIEMPHLYARRYNDLVLIACPDAPTTAVPGMHVVPLDPAEALSELWLAAAAAADGVQVLEAAPRAGETPFHHADPASRTLDLVVLADGEARSHLHERLDTLGGRLDAGVVEQARALIGRE